MKKPIKTGHELLMRTKKVKQVGLRSVSVCETGHGFPRMVFRMNLNLCVANRTKLLLG